MISPDKVNEASALKEDENLEFRTFLKIHANEKELDEHFLRLHEELFQSYDCRQCRNCCKEYAGSIPWSDVRKDARYLKMPYRQFMEKYLKENDCDGIYETKHVPCDFLNDQNECILGDCRPDNCKKYPYTNQPERLQSLYSVLEAVSVCPVAYEIFERLIHSCIDMEIYNEGCDLAETLSFLEVSASGDYNDYDGSPLGVQELYEHNLLEGNFEVLVKECLYLVYMANKLSDRADEMFCMIENFGCYHIRLEDILQTGNRELPEFNEFLTFWIECLGKQRGRRTEELLTATYAEKMCDFEKAENCWLEAFRSNCSIINYMRLRFMTRHWQQYKAEVNSISEALFIKTKKEKNPYAYTMEQERENTISKEDYCTFLFFEQQFDKMEEIGMNTNKSLGWSETYMKQGISFMLLLLFRGDALPSGLQAMLNRAISACGFKAGEMEKYKKEYSRRRAFHDELRRYGMKK